MASAPVHFRVFLSSPGDLPDERSLARKVLNNLPSQPFIRNRATLQVLSWDDPNARTPLYANLTPQAALMRQMTRPGECDIVVTILWSRMGTPLPEDDPSYRKPDGSRYLSGTEWEYEDAIRSRKPLVLVYRRTEKPKIELDDPEFDAKRKQYELVNQFFQRFQNADGSSRGGYIPYESPSEFERQLDSDIRSVLEDLLSRAAVPEPKPSAQPAGVAEGWPYPGLRRLTESDASMFFGRGRETDDLIRRLCDGQRAVFIVGASGSGKSSLVRAGLLPRLRGNAVYGSKDWLYASFAPADLGENPFLALAAAVAPFLEGARTPLQIANQFVADPESARTECSATLARRAEWARFLIFIDQLEELFTISAPRLRDSFVQTIDALASMPSVVLVSTMRADFFPNAVTWPRLADILQRGHYLLLPPGLQALSDIVRLPAERSGVTIENGLLDQLIRDAGFEPGTLPLLAYTLEQLYRSSGARRKLTRSAYEALGGIRGAIGKRAAESFQTVDTSAREALNRLFTQLLTINEEGIATRRRALQREIVTDQTTEELVRLLVKARLLIADRRDNENTIEIAHEALFDGWEELRQWIAENREFLLWRSRLRFRIAEWQRTRRDEGASLQGTALEEALQWLKRQPGELTSEEREFIEWPLSDAFQARKAIDEGRELIAGSGDRIASGKRRSWLTCLIVAGQGDEGLASDALFAEARLEAAALLGQAGKYDDANDIVKRMAGTERVEACTRLAEIAAKAGDTEQALQAVELIEDELLAVRALAQAAAAGDAGRRALAEVLVQHSFSRSAAAGYFRDPAALDEAEWNRVAADAKSVPLGFPRAVQLSTLLRALAAIGREELAGDIADALIAAVGLIRETWWQGAATVRAVAAVADGWPALAEQIARAAATPAFADYALAILAQHRARGGVFREALALASEVAGRISETSMPAVTDILTNVVGLCGRHGRAEEGKRLTEQLSKQVRSENRLCRLAEAYILCGAVDQAVRLVPDIPVESWRTEAFRKVALLLAEREDFEAVMELSRLGRRNRRRNCSSPRPTGAYRIRRPDVSWPLPF
jgi:hypothetical protein